jgi:FAD binding domain
VIAGGGPVGSFLACELRLAGVSVLVLERMEDPHSPLKAGWMGMRGLNFPSVEAFYRRGLLEEVRASALGWMRAGPNPGMELRDTTSSNSAAAPRFAGHLPGTPLDVEKTDCSNRKYGPSASGGMVSLEGIELLFAERATGEPKRSRSFVPQRHQRIDFHRAARGDVACGQRNQG